MLSDPPKAKGSLRPTFRRHHRARREADHARPPRSPPPEPARRHPRRPRRHPSRLRARPPGPSSPERCRRGPSRLGAESRARSQRRHRDGFESDARTGRHSGDECQRTGRGINAWGGGEHARSAGRPSTAGAQGFRRKLSHRAARSGVELLAGAAFCSAPTCIEDRSRYDYVKWWRSRAMDQFDTVAVNRRNDVFLSCGTFPSYHTARWRTPVDDRSRNGPSLLYWDCV